MIRPLRALLLTLALLLPSPAAAQVSVTADRIYLGATGCALRTGSGAPTGGVACDFYLDTATGHIWINHAGTWIDASTRTPTFQTVTASTSISTPLLAAAGDLTLRPAADLILDPTGRDVFPGSSYAINIGGPARQFLTAHFAELWASTLVAQDVLSTIGGRIIVAPTTTLAADLAPAATTITVKQNNLQNGDRVLMQTAPNGIAQTEWLGVSSAAGGTAGAYTYTVTRNLDGSGANQWYAGDAILNTGSTGKGFIDLFALTGVVSGFGPTIVGNVRTGAAFNAISPRWAIGNLNNVGFGHQTDTWGIAGGNPAGAFFYTDDQNGLVMGGPAGTRVHITPAGAAIFSGDGGGLTSISGGNITTGSIGAGALYVGTSNGAALNDDPGTQDASAWAQTNTAIVDTGSNGMVGHFAIQSGAGGGYANGARLVPVDVAKAYRVRFWAQAAAGTDGVLYSGVSLRDGSGNPILTGGGEWFWCASGVAASAWTEFSCAFGAGTAQPLPANARSMYPIAYFNYAGSTGWWRVQDFRLEEMAPSTLIKNGAITTDKIVAGAITTDKIAAGSITADKIAAGVISADVIASGTNRIRNSECRVSTEDWTVATNSGQTAAVYTQFGAPWMLNNEPGTCFLQTDNVPANGTVTYVQSTRSAAMAGQWYEGSVYLGTHGGSASYLVLGFQDLDGNVLLYKFGTNCSQAQGFGGNLLSGYCRSWAVGQAPANTASVFLHLQHVHDGVRATPYLFFVRAMIAEAKPNQPGPSEWTPGGITEITGGIIRTNAITASKIAAGSITAGKIAAGSITSTEIAAATITGGNIAGSTITGTQIAAATIAGGHIAARTIAAGNLAASTITATEIASRTITGDRIQAGAISASEIAAGSITADRLNVATLSAISANLGTVTAGNISGNTITGGSISGTTISGSTIYAGGGSTIVLDNNGMAVAEGNGLGSARIQLGGNSIWGSGSTIVVDRNFAVNQGLNVAGGATFSSSISIQSPGQVTFSGSPGVTFGYYLTRNGSCSCLREYNGPATSAASTNIQPWTGPTDPLAVITVPLVRYDMPGNPAIKLAAETNLLGVDAAQLAAIIPEAVLRDDQGRPNGVRQEILTLYMLAGMRALSARAGKEATEIAELQQRIADLEQQLAALSRARRGGIDR